MSLVAVALVVFIVASTAIGILRVPRVRVNTLGRRSVLRHPGLWLLVVTALIYLNQVLFTIYVMRVWHGEPTFIAQYLPPGWFALADHNSVITWLAPHFPAPGLLAWSVLRVQAFLELPFVVLAYLTICRWFGPDLYQRTLRLAWAAAASYTATFCLVEWSLRNPYTLDDLVIRLAAAVVTPLGISRLTERGGSRVSSAFDLVAFVVSVVAVGYLVLVVYDTALLYNLGHLGSLLPGVIVATAVLTAARLAAGRLSSEPAGPGIDTVNRSLGWLLAFFFVPALAIRYGLGFGAPIVSVTAGLIVTFAAAIYGAREVLSRMPGSRGLWIAEMAAALAAGTASAYVGFACSHGYPEARLLIAATAFFLIVTAVCAVIDGARTRRSISHICSCGVGGRGSRRGAG